MLSCFWNVPILGYHRIGEPKGDHVPTVTPESFEKQMAFLARRRYRVMSLDDCVRKVAAGEPFSPRSVGITFDDGYEETLTIAAPLLHQHGFCATVFVTPGEVGYPGFMTWDQVRQIAQNGFTVGSHTMHHTYLPMTACEKVRRELAESKQILEQQLSRPIQWLSYPVGGYTPAIQALAREVGYRAACTTNRGVSKWTRDLFALRRIKMTERDGNPALMQFKLSGYYDLFRRLGEPA